MGAGEGRVHEGARAEESDPARRLVQLAVVAKRKPEQPATRRVLPMELQVGDRLVDETGEWEVIGPLYRSPDGKNAGARVRKVGRADVTEVRTWSAHEHIRKRATSEEGKR